MSAEAVPARSLVRPITGPSALGGGGLRRLGALTVTLAYTEFKLRFFGSVLGYLWQLMRPLLLFGVLYVVFTRAIRLGNGVPHFPAVLLMNIVLWTFFAEATGGAVGSVVDRENLVRKIEFPRLAIPLSMVLTAAFNLALNLVVILIFVLAQGVPVRLAWLEMIPLVLLLALLASGVATLLSSLFVRFRDVRPIWDVGLQVLFYGSPILYPLEIVPHESWRHLLMINPIAAILQQVRHAVIDVHAASAATAAGGLARLAVPAAILVVVVLLGYRVFDREAPKVAENL